MTQIDGGDLVIHQPGAGQRLGQALKARRRSHPKPGRPIGERRGIAGRERASTAGSVEGRGQSGELFRRGVGARNVVPLDAVEGDDQVVEEAAGPTCDRALMAGQGDAVLVGAGDVPILGGDLGVLAHAHAGGPVDHPGHEQAQVLGLDPADGGQAVRERPGLDHPSEPVGEISPQADLHPAHALGAAHHGQVTAAAIDHAGGLEGADHAGGAGHHRGDGRDGGVEAGVQQHLPGEIAPGEVGDHRAPDREVRPNPHHLARHMADDGDRQPDGVEARERPVDLEERGADPRGEPDVRLVAHGRSWGSGGLSLLYRRAPPGDHAGTCSSATTKPFQVFI